MAWSLWFVLPFTPEFGWPSQDSLQSKPCSPGMRGQSRHQEGDTQPFCQVGSRSRALSHGSFLFPVLLVCYCLISWSLGGRRGSSSLVCISSADRNRVRMPEQLLLGLGSKPVLGVTAEQGSRFRAGDQAEGPSTGGWEEWRRSLVCEAAYLGGRSREHIRCLSRNSQRAFPSQPPGGAGGGLCLLLS